MTSTRDISDQERERQEELERLRAEVARWRARYAAAEKRDLAFVNSEGDVEAVYTSIDVEHLDAADKTVSDEDVILRPFPQVATGGKSLPG